MLTYNTPYLTATYDADLNAVVAVWNGFAQPAEARAGHEALRDMFRYYEASYLLNDLREHEGGFGAVQEWLQETYLPDMVKLGYAACANVMPEDFMACVSMHDLETRQGGVVPTRMFTAPADARQWIGSLRRVRRTQQEIA